MRWPRTCIYCIYGDDDLLRKASAKGGDDREAPVFDEEEEVSAEGCNAFNKMHELYDIFGLREFPPDSSPTTSPGRHRNIGEEPPSPINLRPRKVTHTRSIIALF